jgi:hypothetical protein
MAKHSKAVAIHSAIHFQLCTTTNPLPAQWESWKGTDAAQPSSGGVKRPGSRSD